MLEALEKKLPGFSYTIFGYRPNAPVYVQWNHMDMNMQKHEALMPRTVMAKSLNMAFEQILNRYETFEKAEKEVALKLKKVTKSNFDAKLLEAAETTWQKPPKGDDDYDGAVEPPVKPRRKSPV